VWSLEKYEKYTPEDMVFDQFVKGYVDLAILQPTYLTDSTRGLQHYEQNSVMKKLTLIAISSTARSIHATVTPIRLLAPPEERVGYQGCQALYR